MFNICIHGIHNNNVMKLSWIMVFFMRAVGKREVMLNAQRCVVVFNDGSICGICAIRQTNVYIRYTHLQNI